MMFAKGFDGSYVPEVVR